jgi:DNA-binding transcriptional MerR regulator
LRSLETYPSTIFQKNKPNVPVNSLTAIPPRANQLHQAAQMTHDVKTSSFTIRQLAREFGITARALRFYEDKGLIHPERLGQSRLYSARDRVRLIIILRGKRLGFSLQEIHEILNLYNPKDHGIAQMRATVQKYRKQIETLKKQREDIDQAIKDMIEGCAWLEDTITQKSQITNP